MALIRRDIGDAIDGGRFRDQDKVYRDAQREMLPNSMRSIGSREQRNHSSLYNIEEGAPDQSVITAAEKLVTCRSPDSTEHFQTSPNEEVPAFNNNTEANTPKSVGGRPGSKSIDWRFDRYDIDRLTCVDKMPDDTNTRCQLIKQLDRANLIGAFKDVIGSKTLTDDVLTGCEADRLIRNDPETSDETIHSLFLLPGQGAYRPLREPE
jgi:hypothetical protein